MVRITEFYKSLIIFHTPHTSHQKIANWAAHTMLFNSTTRLNFHCSIVGGATSIAVNWRQFRMGCGLLRHLGAPLATYLALGQRSLGHLHLPAEERRYADEGGHNPDRRDHDGGSRRRSRLQIVDGLGDAPVAIQRDEAQVHDRGGAEEDVHRGVDVAPPAAEDPVAH